MNRKDMVEKVVSEIGLPKGKAVKAVDLILKSLVDNGMKGEKFFSPIVKMVSKNVPARTVHDESTGESKNIPEQRQILLRPTQSYLDGSAS